MLNQGNLMMNKALQDNLDGKTGNYILPFFWQHGESMEVLEKEIEAIYNSGIKAFCVESRIYEKFCEGPWWRDFEFILNQAQKRQMQVWLLDDRCFPTGFANGLIQKKYPHLRKWLIRESHVDVAGPAGEIVMLANAWLNPAYEESILSCVAIRRSGIGEEITGKPVDLTANIHDGLLYWNVPEGTWRIFYLIKTRKCDKSYENYIDLINPSSVDVLIEAVYENHYRHFSNYFGNTFAGFFSDEPCLGNINCTYYAKIGTPDMPLPWRDDIMDMLPDLSIAFPALWYDQGSKTAAIRFNYMNIMTEMFRNAFSYRLGDWCRNHGVMYIGHVIEDMNSHSSLGPSAGHFFRNLDGQDMAGIDVVLHQVVPGLSDMPHTAPLWGGIADPEFFHYSLAKLASSHSHIQPLKQGRAMCEIYGAYGWAEGLPMMKWITDHMLVRGINHFVPHAFSPKYPDPDGPPHFYAGANNPQYFQFRYLMGYANRISHIFSAGTHVASAAILYHADAEWTGGKTMFSQKPAKQLADRQIDYDIIPADVLHEASEENEKLRINDELYECLIVPYAEIMPLSIMNHLCLLAEKGVSVIFVDGLPVGSAEGKAFDQLPGFNLLRIIPLEKISDTMLHEHMNDICVDGYHPMLRFYHYRHGQNDFYMFFNEDVNHVLNAVVNTGNNKTAVLYDAFENRLESAPCKEGVINLCLAPYESKLFAFGSTDSNPVWNPPPRRKEPQNLDLLFDIELKSSGDTAYKPYRKASPLVNITSIGGQPGFVGYIRYTAIFDCHDYNFNYLEFENIYETAHVLINGQDLGDRICPPYRFTISGLLKEQGNTIEVIVVNNPAHRERDPLSRFLPIPPSGIIGTIKLS